MELEPNGRYFPLRLAITKCGHVAIRLSAGVCKVRPHWTECVRLCQRQCSGWDDSGLARYQHFDSLCLCRPRACGTNPDRDAELPRHVGQLASTLGWQPAGASSEAPGDK